tara:strand:- start:475 stop:1482 length:1008 start_codon:yes stop_codon:yes gene_type:complete
MSFPSILVTGGCGFIGSHFITYIFDKYPDIPIVNIDVMYYCASLDNIPKYIQEDNRYTFISANITNAPLIETLLKTYKITHVIHFAAQSHVQNSFSDALQYTNDNVVGTHTLLECCRKYKRLELFVHISTDEVYGESAHDTDSKKNEQSILCPTNPYAATKAAAEMLVQSYYHSFDFPVIITRGNNVYGNNQYPEKVIPLFFKQLSENKKITIQGDGSCVRAFMHVDDVVRAIDTIVQKGIVGEIYNIGCDDGMEISILELAEKIILLVKKVSDTTDWLTYIPDRPFNDKRYYISNSKLKSLGWSVSIQLDEGLGRYFTKIFKKNDEPNELRTKL